MNVFESIIIFFIKCIQLNIFKSIQISWKYLKFSQVSEYTLMYSAEMYLKVFKSM